MAWTEQYKRERYGPEHRQARKAWAPIVAQGGVTCARYGEPDHPDCPGPIQPGTPWQLDHTMQGSHPAHRACNERAGALNRNRLYAKHRPTRDW